MTGGNTAGVLRPRLAILEAAYDNANAFPGSQALFACWDEESRRFRKDAPATATGLLALLDQRYAADEKCRLDLFLAADSTRPLLIFFHGGYWHLNSKDRFSFVARFAIGSGFHAAIVGYPLAPAATMTDIVAAARASIGWIAANAQRHQWPVARLGVMGWSAGAHLAALMLKHPAVEFGIGLSGIYNLRPIQRISLNSTVGLNDCDVEMFSPLYQIEEFDPPFSVAVGQNELIGLRSQTRQFHRRRQRRGPVTVFWEVPGRNHFEVLDALVDGDSAMAKFVAAAAGAH